MGGGRGGGDADDGENYRGMHTVSKMREQPSASDAADGSTSVRLHCSCRDSARVNAGLAELFLICSACRARAK